MVDKLRRLLYEMVRCLDCFTIYFFSASNSIAVESPNEQYDIKDYEVNPYNQADWFRAGLEHFCNPA